MKLPDQATCKAMVTKKKEETRTHRRRRGGHRRVPSRGEEKNPSPRLHRSGGSGTVGRVKLAVQREEPRLRKDGKGE